MMMRALVDETVLIDFLGERRFDFACWNKLGALELTGCVRLWTTAEAHRLLRESLAGALPEQEVRSALLETADYIPICPVGRGEMAAMPWLEGPRESALMERAAFKTEADCVVSRRKYEGLSVPVLTPEGLFEHLERDEGLVFELVDF